jgi:hypothetical protein
MTIETEAGRETSTWHVAIGFYPDPAGRLLEQAQALAEFDEKAIPEAGVAVRLRQNEQGAWATATVEGRLYCGLPLPATSGLPVQINGCFDLDSSRTGLTSDDAFLGTAKVRVEWNRLLLNYAVVSAYTDALRSLPREIAENDPDAFYSLWPNTAAATSPILRDTALQIHRALATVPLFRCVTKQGVAWLDLGDILLIPAHAEPGLMDPLVEDGLILASPPLPPALVSDASAAGIEVPLVTPGLLRKRWLRSESKDCDIQAAPFPALRRREWLDTITRFMMSDPSVQLMGLPLALLANGQLATFGFAQAGTLFVGTDVQREIFRTRLHWFIDPDYQTTTGLRPQPAAKFVELSPQSVMLNLHSVLPKIEVGGRREWNAAGDGIPEARWLTFLLDYLTENAAAVSVSDLQEFPLIPDQHGRLHSPHCIPTPLLRSKAPEGLIAALEALGTPLVSGPDELVHAVERFAHAFGDELLVWDADGPDLIDPLKAYEGEWTESAARNDPKVVGAILDCLAQPRSLDRIDDRLLGSLKSLPLIPTGGGAVVSANEPNLFVPSGEQPPKATGAVKLVQVRGRWKPLLEKLGIPPLDLPALIKQVLIPSYGNEARSDQLEILRYVRDHFSRALDQETAGGGPPTIKSLLANSDLIVATNGELRPVSDLFVPDYDEAVLLLGELAAFPDMNVYAPGREAWMSFFLSLGLKEEIGADDILARVLSLTSVPPSRESRRAVQRIFSFIQRNWDRLSNQDVGEPGSGNKLPTALKSLAWLPSVQDETAFPGFRKPEDRWYRLDELYPRSLGHRVSSQAPLFEGQEPAGRVQAALGMPARPPLELVTAHFDRLRELWADATQSVDIDALTTSLNQIYSYFGQQSRPQHGMPAAGPILKARYAEMPCIWDRPRRRFVRPRDCFSDRVAFFEPHKVCIGGDPQIQAGLDALGRRQTPELDDYIGFFCRCSAPTNLQFNLLEMAASATLASACRL